MHILTECDVVGSASLPVASLGDILTMCRQKNGEVEHA